MPDEIPVTTPEALTVAVDGLLLLHAPLMVPSVKLVVAPVHTAPVPLMAAGDPVTVTVVTAKHPERE